MTLKALDFSHIVCRPPKSLKPALSAMAIPARLGRQASSLLSRHCAGEARPAFRTFRTLISSPKNPSKVIPKKTDAILHARSFCSSRRQFATPQEAPNAKAYLESGAIHGARELVNVKKVLVIGSGGLSIGQAGEFDYSGKTRFA